MVQAQIGIEGDGKKIIKSLKEDFGISSLPDYVAISYDHLFKGECIDLHFCIVRFSKNSIEIDKKEHKIKLRPNNSLRETNDNIIGLFKKIHSKFDAYSPFFERTLSNILVKYIVEQIKETKIVVLQGPIFPELAYMLGNLYLDNSIIVLGLTFDSGLIPIQRNEIVLEDSDSKDPDSKDSDSNSFNIGNVLNSKICECVENVNIQSALRRWVVFDEGEHQVKDIRLVIDAFCQFPYIEDKGKYIWNEMVEKIKTIFSPPGLIISGSGDVWLPFGLSVAYQATRQESLTVEQLNNLEDILSLFEKDVESKVIEGEQEVVLIRTRLRMFDKIKSKQKIMEKIKEIAKKEGISVEVKSKNIEKAIPNLHYEVDGEIWKCFL